MLLLLLLSHRDHFWVNGSTATSSSRLHPEDKLAILHERLIFGAELGQLAE